MLLGSWIGGNNVWINYKVINLIALCAADTGQGDTTSLIIPAVSEIHVQSDKCCCLIK